MNYSSLLAFVLFVVFTSTMFMWISYSSEMGNDHIVFSDQCKTGFVKVDEFTNGFNYGCYEESFYNNASCSLGYYVNFVKSGEWGYEHDTYNCLKDNTPFGIECRLGYGVGNPYSTDFQEQCVPITGHWKELIVTIGNDTQTYKAVVSNQEYLIDLIENNGEPLQVEDKKLIAIVEELDR